MTISPSDHDLSEKLQLSFDADVYSLSAIKKAAYKLASQCSALIAQNESKDRFLVTLTPLKALEHSAREALEHRFLTEALDQDLRESIAQETEMVRNLILAQAFSRTSLLDEES